MDTSEILNRLAIVWGKFDENTKMVVSKIVAG